MCCIAHAVQHKRQRRASTCHAARCHAARCHAARCHAARCHVTSVSCQCLLDLPDIPVKAPRQAVKPVGHMTSVIDARNGILGRCDDNTGGGEKEEGEGSGMTIACSASVHLKAHMVHLLPEPEANGVEYKATCSPHYRQERTYTHSTTAQSGWYHVLGLLQAV